MAKRLARSNTLRSRDFSAGIAGRLSEITPSELLQTLNMNHKSGVVYFQLPENSAQIALREGALVRAELDNLKDADAFFEILKLREGRFKFSPDLSARDSKAPVLGDFMWLLMEGLNRIDEETKNES